MLTMWVVPIGGCLWDVTLTIPRVHLILLNGTWQRLISSFMAAYLKLEEPDSRAGNKCGMKSRSPIAYYY